MKYVLEFGIVGGYYSDNTVVPTRKLAEEMAERLHAVFTAGTGPGFHRWTLRRGDVRKSWSDGKHFIAISKLDGIGRGPATSFLWGIKEVEDPLGITTITESQERAAGWR